MADDPFGSMFDKFKKGHRLSTEALFVYKLGQTVGISRQQLSKLCRVATGFGTPSLLWFSSHFRSFPTFLGYRTTPHVRDSLREFSQNFLKSSVFESWQAIAEQNDDEDRATGCLFMWPRFGRAVVYSAVEYNTSKPGVAVTIKLKTGQFFVVQHWKDWLAQLDWRPQPNELENG